MRTSFWNVGTQMVRQGVMGFLDRLSLYCCGAWMLASPTAVWAAPPTGAVVIEPTSNTNIMIRRPNRASIPAAVNQKMRGLDMIVVPAKSMSRATIRILGPDLKAQLVGLAKRTAWRLPCEVSGSGFVAWGEGIDQGCMPPGVVVRANLESISAAPMKHTLIASASYGFLPTDALAQVSQFFKVCSATNELGENAHTVISLFFLNPCTTAVDRCEQTGSSSCMVVSEGVWTSSRSRAFMVCGDKIEKLRDKDALMVFLNSLVGQSTNCVAQVLSPGDSLLIPDRGNRATIAFENDGSGSTISVIKGKVNIVSSQSDDWLTLVSGETYIAGRGERMPTSDWLRESELCSSMQRPRADRIENSQNSGTPVLAQINPPLEEQAAGENPFGSIYSQYCSPQR